MTNVGYAISENQGRIFEYIAGKYNFKTFLSFVPVYMSSDFCRTQWDVPYSRFQINLVGENLDFIMPELDRKMVFVEVGQDDKIFDPDAAWWAGFTYRQINLLTGIPSREIIRKVPLDKLCAAYPGLHTISDEISAEQIIQDYLEPELQSHIGSL